MNDPIGDMLTRIRNAQMRGKSTTMTPASKLRGRVLAVMADEGYIRGFEETKDVNGHPAYEISLKYYDGTPVIRELKRVSKPGRRVYLEHAYIHTNIHTYIHMHRSIDPYIHMNTNMHTYTHT